LPQVLPFLAIAVFVVVTPGVDTALVTKNALLAGRRGGVFASVGVATGLAIWTLAAAVGVAAVLRASEVAFLALKIAGAIYLVWMGARMILAKRAAVQRPETAPETSTRSAFSLGVVTQGANPKAIVFFTAILPQFVDPSAAIVPQIVILGITSIAIELGVLSAYVATCHAARGLVGETRFARRLQRLGGAFLITAGARLAVSR